MNTGITVGRYLPKNWQKHLIQTKATICNALKIDCFEDIKAL